MVSLFSLVLFAIGLPIAYAGWRIYEGMIFIAGWAAGLALGYVAGVYLSTPGSIGAPGPGLPAVFATVCSVAGMYIAYASHRLVHGFTGFAVATIIGYATLNNIPAAALLGLGGGYATWMFHKSSVIVLTSIVGGMLVSFGFGLQDSANTQLLLVLVVALSGMVVQFGLFRSFQPRASEGEDMVYSCPSCGHPCEPEHAYCQGCGEELCLCESCGRIGLQSWAFCDACGQSMEPE